MQDIFWWLLPDDVGLTLAAIFMVSGLLMSLIFDGVAPKEQPAYVPKKRRRCKSCLSIALLGALDQCATTLTERINNMKVQRRYHLPRLRYSEH